MSIEDKIAEIINELSFASFHIGMEFQESKETIDPDIYVKRRSVAVTHFNKKILTLINSVIDPDAPAHTRTRDCDECGGSGWIEDKEMTKEIGEPTGTFCPKCKEGKIKEVLHKEVGGKSSEGEERTFTIPVTNRDKVECKVFVLYPKTNAGGQDGYFRYEIAGKSYPLKWKEVKE